MGKQTYFMSKLYEEIVSVHHIADNWVHSRCVLKNSSRLLFYYPTGRSGLVNNWLEQKPVFQCLTSINVTEGVVPCTVVRGKGDPQGWSFMSEVGKLHAKALIDLVFESNGVWFQREEKTYRSDLCSNESHATVTS